jgi:hypothetical protein
MTPTTLRIGLLGVSHWHCELYLEPLRKLNGVEIVGVSDPRPRVAQDMAEDLGCYWSEDFRDVCDRAKPESRTSSSRSDATAIWQRKENSFWRRIFRSLWRSPVG